VKHETRALVRVLYFVEHLSLDVIAKELRLRPRTVRRALVLPGGARRRPGSSPTPHRKENDA